MLRPTDPIIPLKDGSWWLGFVPDLAEKHGGGWLPIAWGDNGWEDRDYNEVSPCIFAALPDPQPQPTGWQPAVGKVVVQQIDKNSWRDDQGKPLNMPFDWGVSIEKPDGSYDLSREWTPCTSEVEADEEGRRWAARYGLDVEKVYLPSNIISMADRRR